MNRDSLLGAVPVPRTAECMGCGRWTGAPVGIGAGRDACPHCATGLIPGPTPGELAARSAVGGARGAESGV